MSKKWIETWLTERPNVHEESHSEGPMGDCPWVECRAAAEIADLREKCERLHEAWGEDAVRAETYREGLEEIESWAGAYPVEVFPEMTKTDWKNVAAILKEHGYTIDRISASNMRHALKGVGRIARETLEKGEKLNAMDNTAE